MVTQQEKQEKEQLEQKEQQGQTLTDQERTRLNELRNK